MTRDGVLLVFALMLAQFASGATLRGRVLEDRSGSAVAAASLRIQQSSASAVAAEVETDAEGRFDVPGLAEGEYRVSGLPPGEYAVAVSWSGSDIVRSRMRSGAVSQILTAFEKSGSAILRAGPCPAAAANSH
jgi:5-hydroxyisourate hydrolase-like protein (transthyretin family)